MRLGPDPNWSMRVFYLRINIRILHVRTSAHPQIHTCTFYDRPVLDSLIHTCVLQILKLNKFPEESRSNLLLTGCTLSNSFLFRCTFTHRSIWCTSSVTVITHSLTPCCAWPAEGRSVLHIERSWPAIQAAPTDRPTSSSTCCSQFLRGRPGGRFQSAAGGVPDVSI